MTSKLETLLSIAAVIASDNTDLDELLGKDLPKPDCTKCRFSPDPAGEGHCYMFREEPYACQQFKATD